MLPLQIKRLPWVDRSDEEDSPLAPMNGDESLLSSQSFEADLFFVGADDVPLADEDLAADDQELDFILFPTDSDSIPYFLRLSDEYDARPRTSSVALVLSSFSPLPRSPLREAILPFDKLLGDLLNTRETLRLPLRGATLMGIVKGPTRPVIKDHVRPPTRYLAQAPPPIHKSSFNTRVLCFGIPLRNGRREALPFIQLASSISMLGTYFSASQRLADVLAQLHKPRGMRCRSIPRVRIVYKPILEAMHPLRRLPCRGALAKSGASGRGPYSRAARRSQDYTDVYDVLRVVCIAALCCTMPRSAVQGFSSAAAALSRLFD
ncbi:hypothetical protein K523DRAFT_357237 [Schizophyllum commune Tattone D]|nr:hypothetical protein K523DRAFT_357237 [Schizophyllum commune Tattone D]